MNKVAWLALSFFFMSAVSLQAAEENKPETKSSSVKNIATGVKQVAYDAPKDLAEETLVEGPKEHSITSVVEGVNRGIKKSLDQTLKGAYRVATLGHSELESYKVEEPEKGSDETSKIKISLPGT